MGRGSFFTCRVVFFHGECSMLTLEDRRNEVIASIDSVPGVLPKHQEWAKNFVKKTDDESEWLRMEEAVLKLSSHNVKFIRERMKKTLDVSEYRLSPEFTAFLAVVHSPKQSHRYHAFT